MLIEISQILRNKKVKGFNPLKRSRVCPTNNQSTQSSCIRRNEVATKRQTGNNVPRCISVITLIINRRRGKLCRNRVWPKYWRRRQNLVTIAATMDIRPAHGDLSRRSATSTGLANQTSHEIWP